MAGHTGTHFGVSWEMWAQHGDHLCLTVGIGLLLGVRGVLPNELPQRT